MKMGSNVVIAAALFASMAGLGSTASAMPLAKMEAAISTATDGAKIDHVRWCNWRGCYPGWGYRYRVYSYRPYAYYRPWGYRYVVPGVRFGWY